MEDILLSGGVVVMRTDTLYGLLALASNEQAVKRVYALKGRDSHKPPIVLVADISQMFDPPDQQTELLLRTVWPGKVSVVVKSLNAPNWITRNGTTVAYRIPNDNRLLKILKKTGPLIAPSANPQSMPPATTIVEAQNYFQGKVDWYEDTGTIKDNTPSSLIRLLADGTIEKIR
jgi:L-threonylcarbamoyladenylate synthase